MSDYRKAVAAMSRLNDLMGEHVPDHAKTDAAADDIWTMFSIIEDHNRRTEELTAAKAENEWLAEMVRSLAYEYHLATGGNHHQAAHELLAQLDAGTGGQP